MKWIKETDSPFHHEQRVIPINQSSPWSLMSHVTMCKPLLHSGGLIPPPPSRCLRLPLIDSSKLLSLLTQSAFCLLPHEDIESVIPAYTYTHTPTHTHTHRTYYYLHSMCMLAFALWWPETDRTLITVSAVGVFTSICVFSHQSIGPIVEFEYTVSGEHDYLISPIWLYYIPEMFSSEAIAIEFVPMACWPSHCGDRRLMELQGACSLQSM